ncbi:hypothetical protein CALVIDRAFT_107865 [Calocera viscosa TUFC12733]|uniref:Uncharacterized protein n=1 Tax=Calocera viscosa (strain TUFC12733) TaxID=1330018 RepID=A0A167MCI4_CALVF|nr:hypothetical protein CALVIDRAFT_107865 [Calocera viscosa TUFC12733]
MGRKWELRMKEDEEKRNGKPRPLRCSSGYRAAAAVRCTCGTPCLLPCPIIPCSLGGTGPWPVCKFPSVGCFPPCWATSAGGKYPAAARPETNGGDGWVAGLIGYSYGAYSAVGVPLYFEAGLVGEEEGGSWEGRCWDIVCWRGGWEVPGGEYGTVRCGG